MHNPGIKLLFVAALACGLPMLAQADCRETLAEVDARLAATEVDASIRGAVQQFRDQGADACAKGSEPTAMQVLGLVSMMLDQVEAEQAEAARRAAPPPPPPPPTPVAEQLASARADFPNRWDKLTDVDFCQWLTTDELAKELEFRAPLSCRKTKHGFVMTASVEGDSWPEQVFMLITEVHPTQETVREAEANTTDDFSQKLFTPFNAGASDLHVYLANRGHYLYAFPSGGLTLWRLEYLRPGEKRDRYYVPSPGRSGNPDLGPRFMELLVAKYGSKL